MFDYREYFIAIAAIFLALALGILIGVSFGENFLVSNQRDIIELLEQELSRRKSIIDEKNQTLERWEQVKPLLKRGYTNSLSGKVVALVAHDREDAAELQELLESAGAAVDLYTSEAVLAPVAGGSFAETGLSPAADCFIILMAGTPDLLGQQIWDLLLQQEAKQVIAAYPWTGTDRLHLPAAGERCGVIDNIDTFWGQIALLEMIVYGKSGYYGFGTRGQGLFPRWEEISGDVESSY